MLLLPHLQRIILAFSLSLPATIAVQTEIKLSSSATTSSSTITTPTVNPHVATENRERFVNEKENDMLKKFITELNVSFEQLFTDDVRNDQNNDRNRLF